MKHWNRTLAALLTVVMVLSLVVVPAGAAVTAGHVGYIWDFTDSTSAFNAGDAPEGRHGTGTYGSQTVNDGGVDVTWDTLILSGLTGSYNKGFCYVGGTLTIPVAEACNVAVTTQYGADATMKSSTDTGAGVALVKGDTAVYPMPAAGSVVITGGSSATYVTKIELQAYVATSAKLASDSVVLTLGGSAADVAVTASGGDLTALAATSSAAGVATVTPDKTNSKITVTPVAKGTATVTVKATVGSDEKTVTLAVRVVDPASTLSTTKTSYDFNEQADYYADGVTIEKDAFYINSPHGAEGKGTVTLKIPSGKKASFKVKTCTYNAGTTATITSDECTVGTATEWEESKGNNGLVFPITEAKGTVVLTFGSGNNKSVDIHGLEDVAFTDDAGSGTGGTTPGAATGKKIDVWDFPAKAESNTDLYNNNITAASWTAQSSKINGNKQLNGTFTFGDVSYVTGSNDRLYTSDSGLSSINYESGKYKNTVGDYTSNGGLYGNGGGSATERTLTIANVKAGDKIVVYMGSHNSTASTYSYGKTTDTALGSVSVTSAAPNVKLEFVAPADSSYVIWQSDGTGKIMYYRVMRIPSVSVEGTIDLGGYNGSFGLKFVNQTTEEETVATVDGTSFSVNLAPGYTYTAAITGATGWGITNASKQLTLKNSDIANVKTGVALVVEQKSLYTYSGSVTGFAADYAKKGDVEVTLVPDAASAANGAGKVKLTLDNTLAWSEQLEKGITYTVTLGGVNDYEITSGGTVTVAAGGADTLAQNIAVAPKALRAVSGNFVTLDLDDQYAPLKASHTYDALSATVTALTFTNVDDGYAYTATVSGGGYTANLRDGAYLASATVDGYATKTHAVVNGGALTRDLLFMPTTSPATTYAADVYVDPTNAISNKPSGAPTFKTVTGALDYIGRMTRDTSGGLEADRVTVHIAPGTYREQLAVGDGSGDGKWANITFTPASDTGTVTLTWYYGIGYLYYSATGVKSTESWYDPALAYDQYSKNTAARWGCTLRLRDTGFRAEDIVFESSFNNYMTTEEVKDGVTPGGADKKDFARTASADVKSDSAVERAAAIWMDSTNNRSDMAEFKNCKFLSSQDTLGTGDRAYFKDCFIQGGTDYICGPGDVVFDNCTLSWKGYTENAKSGYITAPQSGAEEKGYFFSNCTVERDTTVSGIKHTGGYFGRNWSAKARAVFMNTLLKSASATDLIVAAGWGDWNATQKAKDARFAEYGTVYGTAEPYSNASTSSRVQGTVLTQAQAEAITVADFFGDWTPTYYEAPAEATKVTSITVTGPNNATSTRLNAGTAQEVQLTATVLPATAEEKGVTWSVADTTGKVTVSDAGKVSIAADAAEGTYTVTAASKEQDSTVKGTYTITLLAAGVSTEKPRVHVFETGDVAAAVGAILGEANEFTSGDGTSGAFVYASGTGITGTATHKRAYKGQELDRAAKVTATNKNRVVTVTVPGAGTVTILANNESETPVADKVAVSGGVGELDVAHGDGLSIPFTVTAAGAYEITPVNVSSDGSAEGLPFFHAIIWTPAGYSHTHSAEDMVQGELVSAATTTAAAKYKFYCSDPFCTETEERDVGEPTGGGQVDPTTYAVTVTGGTANPTAAAEGAQVTVTATVPNGKVFKAWTSSDITISETDAVKNPLTFAMPGKAVAITATFEDEQGGTNPPTPSCAHEHTRTEGAVAATCTEAGKTGTVICEDCGETIKNSTAIPALGHLWDEGTVTKEATCTETGEKLQSCTRQGCNETRTVEVSKIPHNYEDGVCTMCGAKRPTSSSRPSSDRTPSSGSTTPSTGTETGTTPSTGTETGTGTETTAPSTSPAEAEVKKEETHVKNDGTKVTTETLSDDTTRVTEVTMDGDVSVEITDAEGEKLVDMEVPADIPAPKTRFDDVPEEHWAAPAIDRMASLGVVNGVGDNKYDMDLAIDRGSIATMLFRFAGGKEGKPNQFTDTASHWAKDAIGWASATGVVKGYTDGSFHPAETITREQLAVMLYRFAKLIGMDTTVKEGALEGYKDAGSVTWASNEMAWCVSNGIINGVTADTLSAGSTATRAQTAVMMDRFIGLMK